MKPLVVLGCSLLASAATVAVLVSRDRSRWQAQGAALESALTGRGSAFEARLVARGEDAVRELQTSARATADQAAAGQVATSLRAYGITPQFLSRLQAAGARFA